MKQLHKVFTAKEPFTNKNLALRELGRSHVVIISVTLLSIFLVLNNTYGYVDFSGASVRGLVVAMCVLLALVVATSVTIALRAYGAVKK